MPQEAFTDQGIDLSIAKMPCVVPMNSLEELNAHCSGNQACVRLSTSLIFHNVCRNSIHNFQQVTMLTKAFNLRQFRI